MYRLHESMCVDGTITRQSMTYNKDIRRGEKDEKNYGG